MGADLERTAIMRLQEAANMSERFYKAPLIVTTSGEEGQQSKVGKPGGTCFIGG